MVDSEISGRSSLSGRERQYNLKNEKALSKAL